MDGEARSLCILRLLLLSESLSAVFSGARPPAISYCGPRGRRNHEPLSELSNPGVPYSPCGGLRAPAFSETDMGGPGRYKTNPIGKVCASDIYVLTRARPDPVAVLGPRSRTTGQNGAVKAGPRGHQ